MSSTQAKLPDGSDLDLQSDRDDLGSTLRLILYAHFIIFPASYIYAKSVAHLLGLAKWLPLLILALLFLLSSLQQRIVRIDRTATFLLASTVMIAFVSSIASPYGSASLSELVSMTILLLNALFLAALLRRRKAIEQFFEIILNVGRWIIAISFTMAIFGVNLGRGVGRFSGWSDNPNSLALIIVPAIIVLFARVIERRHGWKTRYLPFLLAGLAVILLTNSRGSIGWVLVSFTVFPLLEMKLGFRLIILLFVVTLTLLFGDFLFPELLKLLARGNLGESVSEFGGLLSGREEAWNIAYQSIAEHPLLGLGVGNEQRLLRDHASEFLNHNGMHLHSSYLSILVEIGFIGGIVVGMTLIIAIVGGLKKVKKLMSQRGRSRASNALPVAILLGAMSHAVVETWLFAPGNANSLLFWVLVVYCISSPSFQPTAPYHYMSTKFR